MRQKLKRIAILKYATIVYRAFSIKPGFAERVSALRIFFSDLRNYKRLEKNPASKNDVRDLFPRIFDRTETHGIDPVYFIQGTWCARKIFEANPKRHVDVASQALMVGILAQYVPTIMVDIRPIDISIPGLSFQKGDILRLPFEDGEIESLSSICVIEHIGLGRYGDTLDQFGTEKAARELSRVLSPRGSLYISVPVDEDNKTYFNAHRAFTRDYVLSLFPKLKLMEEKYIYGRETMDKYHREKGFGTGLYHFMK